jgi:hypothetical protein
MCCTTRALQLQHVSQLLRIISTLPQLSCGLLFTNTNQANTQQLCPKPANSAAACYGTVVWAPAATMHRPCYSITLQPAAAAKWPHTHSQGVTGSRCCCCCCCCSQLSTISYAALVDWPVAWSGFLVFNALHHVIALNNLRNHQQAGSRDLN